MNENQFLGFIRDIKEAAYLVREPVIQGDKDYLDKCKIDMWNKPFEELIGPLYGKIKNMRCFKLINAFKEDKGVWKHVCDRDCRFHITEDKRCPKLERREQEAEIIESAWIWREHRRNWLNVDIFILPFKTAENKYALHILKERIPADDHEPPKDIEERVLELIKETQPY